MTVLCAAALMAGCTQPREVNINQLQDQNGFYYLANEEKPFTGVAVWQHKNGQKKREGTFRDGMEHGLHTSWD